MHDRTEGGLRCRQACVRMASTHLQIVDEGRHDDILAAVTVEVGNEGRGVHRGAGLGHPFDLQGGGGSRAMTGKGRGGANLRHSAFPPSEQGNTRGPGCSLPHASPHLYVLWTRPAEQSGLIGAV